MEKRSSAARKTSMVAFIAAAVMVATAYVVYPFVADTARTASREDLLPSGSWHAFGLVALTFSATGFIVHQQQPHLVGWIMHGVGLLLAGGELGTIAYILDGVGWELTVAGRLVAAWSGFSWAPALILMAVFLPLLFPSGRPPSRWWWWVGAIGVAGLLFGFVSVTVDALTGPLDKVVTGESWVILPVLMVAGAVGAMASVVVRYRRAGGVERRQLKWVAMALILVCVTIALALSPIGYEVGTSVLVQLAIMAVMCSIPVSIGIAITRYRLYEIDRIISRTVSYALLSVLLATVYAAAVFGFQQTLRPIIGESQLAVAGATLVVAAVFGPARRRVQSGVDRRFNRARYDAQRVTEAFQIRLRDEIDLDRVATELVAVVHATMDPAAVSLWLRPTR